MMRRLVTLAEREAWLSDLGDAIVGARYVSQFGMIL